MDCRLPTPSTSSADPSGGGAAKSLEPVVKKPKTTKERRPLSEEDIKRIQDRKAALEAAKPPEGFLSQSEFWAQSKTTRARYRAYVERQLKQVPDIYRFPRDVDKATTARAKADRKKKMSSEN